ncbi:MAG: hypothetical protein Q9166_004689 [cf. Caloplaca sp. 2 TL-2023]
METTSDIKSLVDQISSVISQIPSNDRLEPQACKELQGLVKQLSFALETPIDTLNRIVVLPFQHTVVRVAINLNIFEYLLEAGSNGRDTEEIKAKTGVDEVLLLRLLRTLDAIGLLKQVNQKRWAATPRSQACVNPTLKSGFKFMFDLIGPVFQKLPESLAKRRYRCPTALEGPLQDTYDTKLAGWNYVLEPQWLDTLQDCNNFMKGRREGSTSWLEFYPFADKILTGTVAEAGSTLVVDVGGGLGHGLVEIKERFPDMKGRLILQDHPKTIEQAGNGRGIFEPIAHDFFTPQPVKGPKAFLIRQVLHDWPDKECQKILQYLAEAMSPGHSKLLINEYVVADVGASDFVTAIDLVMMGMSGGMERTRSQWSSLLTSVGLRIEQIWTLNEETESVIEAVLDHND